jgi:quinol monooxygenase YgiN
MPHLKNEMLKLVGILMALATSNHVQAQKTEVFGRLTRYAVKPDYQEKFRRSLSEYVLRALAQEGNIQAEAYYERDNQSVLWLVERWRNRNELERFGNNSQSRAIDSLKGNALSMNAETYYVTDLEPISKRQWRRPARAEDHPLTQMLFVDSKEGTQDEFKGTYHVAMPQFRSEPGVVTYQLSQLLGEDTKFVTYEKFRSEEAFQYHLKFPPIKPVIDYLHTNIKKQPFEKGLHTLVEFAPLTRD